MIHTIKLPIDDNKLVVIYTTDLIIEDTYIELLHFLQSINWKSTEWICLPSEYINKVEIIDR